ncbi:MAG: hypothetical protein NTY64_07075, partial [Deltaproteobacteria bacterium]|nr:hypothetical protein [Deltaproteobacteria bacterium]
PTNKKEDFITTVSPGIRFSTLPTGSTTPVLPGLTTLPAITTSPVSGVDLNYLLGLVSYAHSSERNYISHSGTMNAWYLPEHGLNLRLREYFLRSEEPIEQAYAAEAVPGEFILVSQRLRSPYIRNVVEPSAGYRFGKESSFDLYYRNNIYQTQNPASENSQENFINPRLTYWFDIRNGVTLQYGFTRGEFDRSPDFTGHMASGRYIHRFEPHTSVFADYSYLTRDFESPTRPVSGLSMPSARRSPGRRKWGTSGRSPNVGPHRAASLTTWA